MKKRKIFILIPDGVGIRNFIYSSFPVDAENQNLDLTFWNLTGADLAGMGYSEIKLEAKPGALSDLYKRAKIEAELNYFTENFQDRVYQSYKFPNSGSGLKKRVKNAVVSSLIKRFSNKNGLIKLQEKMEYAERKTPYFKHCLEVLKREKPDVLFCTNQRALTTVAPILAAGDLGIPTACFIFSWDNLPKGTKVVNTDYYFVWSDHMKNELLTYYPQIEESNIFITGTPQFQVHFHPELRILESEFYSLYDLKKGRKYLCFSGDDITTSPGDHVYLKDVAMAVSELNKEGHDIGVIFRRAPVDFSNRYDKVLEEFKNIIVPIAPAWNTIGKGWNEVIPDEFDNRLQTSIIDHTFMVINLGSSMVFDYVSYKKPCAFINYDPEGEQMLKDVSVIYKYVHFRTVPNKNAVLWVNSKEEIGEVIATAVKGKISPTVESAEKWFSIINRLPAGKATIRVAKALDEITKIKK